MDRSASFNSADSSAAPDDNSTRGGDIEGEEAKNIDLNDSLKETRPMEVRLFGILFTLLKQKMKISWALAIALLVIDAGQLFLLFLLPSNWWSVDSNLWIWEIVNQLQVTTYIDKGYSIYVVVLYLLGTLICMCLGIAGWVLYCFRKQQFSSVWPISLLYFMIAFFSKTFYVTTLAVLMQALNCGWFSNIPNFNAGYMYLYQDKDCLAMPEIINTAFALVFSTLLFGMTFLTTISDFELSPASMEPLARSDSWTDMLFVIIRTAMTVVAVVLVDFVQVQAVIIFFLMVALVVLQLRWSPFLHTATNIIRCALYTTVCWASAMFVANSFASDGLTGTDRTNMEKMWTLIMVYGIGPALFLGGLGAWLRLEIPRQKLIRAIEDYELNPNGAKIKYMYKFQDPRDVEIAARCTREWIDEDTLEPEAVEMALLVLKAGLARFPSSPYLQVYTANFNIDVTSAQRTGQGQMEAARKLNPSVTQRFAIFIRDQENMLRATNAANGEGDTDLVSYMEFTRIFRQVLFRHRLALIATRSCWRLLLRSRVSFTSLMDLFANIDIAHSGAEKAYNAALERYPRSIKLLKNYGRFLEEVKNEPWQAMEMWAEADHLEEEMHAADNDDESRQWEAAEAQEKGAGTPNAQLSGKNNAVCIINSTGIIQMTNKVLQTTFGYKKEDLDAKNVSMLMPNPFSQQHNSYLSSYLKTGRSHLLDKVREVIGLHKDRYVFPIKILVTQVSGQGEDSIFMGIIKPIEDQPEVVKAWILPTGTVMCVDRRFGDWFGLTATDCVGKHLADLAVDKEPVERALQAATAVFSYHMNEADQHANEQQQPQLGMSLEVIQESAREEVSHQPSVQFQMPQSSPTAPLLPPSQPGQTVTPFQAALNLVPVSPMSVTQTRPKPEEAPKPKPKGLSIFRRSQLARQSQVPDATKATAMLKPLLPTNVAVSMMHSYSNPVPLLLSIEVGGTDKQAIFIIHLRHANQCDELLVTDAQGSIEFVGSALTATLGYGPNSVATGPNLKGLMGQDVTKIMIEPYSTLHRSWIKNFHSLLGTSKGGSCRNGRSAINGNPTTVAVMLSAEKTHIPCKVSMTQKRITEGKLKHIMEVRPVSWIECLDARRIRLALDKEGKVVNVLSASSPFELFGLDPQQLQGLSLEHIISLHEHYRGLSPVSAATGSSGSGSSNQQTPLVAMIKELLGRSKNIPLMSYRVTVNDLGTALRRAAASAGGGEIVVGEIEEEELDKRGRPKMKLNLALSELDEAKVGKPHTAAMTLEPWAPHHTLFMANKTNTTFEYQAKVHNNTAVIASLWGLEALTGIVCVDKDGNVCKAQVSQLSPSGIFWGIPMPLLSSMCLRDIVNLNDNNTSTTFIQKLMTNPNEGSAFKKVTSSLKGAKTETQLVGPPRVVMARHMDGGPLALVLQVIANMKSQRLYYLRIRLATPHQLAAAEVACSNHKSIVQMLLGPTQPNARRPISRSASQSTISTKLVAGPKQVFTMDDPVRAAEGSGSSMRPRSASINGGYKKRLATSTRVPLDLGAALPGAPAEAADNVTEVQKIVHSNEIDEITEFQSEVQEQVDRSRSSRGSSGERTSSQRKPKPARSQSLVNVMQNVKPVLMPNLSVSKSAIKSRLGRSESQDLLSQDPLSIPIASSATLEKINEDAKLADCSEHHDEVVHFADPPLGSGNEKALADALGEDFDDFSDKSVPLKRNSAELVSSDEEEEDIPRMGVEKSAQITNWMSLQSQAGPPATLFEDQPTSPPRLAPNQEKLLEDINEEAQVVAGEPSDDNAAENGIGPGKGRQADVRRGNRFKKILKLLQEKSVQGALQGFNTHAVLLTVAMLFVHIACFAIIIYFLEAQSMDINIMNNAGSAMDQMHILATDARMIQQLHLGVEEAGIYTINQLPYYAELLYNAAEAFRAYHYDSYFGGPGKLSRWSNSQFNLQSFFEMGNWTTTVTLETTPRSYASPLSSIWSLGNLITAYADDIAANHAYYASLPYGLEGNAGWGYISYNAAGSLFAGYIDILDALVQQCNKNIANLNTVIIIILVLEVSVKCVVGVGYLGYLLSGVSNIRVSIFSVLIAVPNGAIRTLASKEVKTEEDGVEDDDAAIDDPEQKDDAENEDAAPGAVPLLGVKKGKLNFGSKRAEGSGIGKGSKRQMSVDASGTWKRRLRGFLAAVMLRSVVIPGTKKELVRNPFVFVWMVLPFLLWAAAVVTIQGVSYSLLLTAQKTVYTLGPVNAALFRASRTIYYAQELVVQTTNAEKDIYRTYLKEELATQKMIWEGISLGTTTFVWDGVRNVTSSSAPLAYSNIAQLFFGLQTCMRINVSTCYVPTDPFYQDTNNGLARAVNVFLDEATQLAGDSDSNLNISNSHLQYIWNAGRNDVHDGLASGQSLYTTDVTNQFFLIIIMQVALLIFALVIAAFFAFFMVPRYTSRAHAESYRLADMLSQLPADMAVESLVKSALGGKKKAGAKSMKEGSRSMTASGISSAKF